MKCEKYIKEAFKEIQSENDFRNAIIHCLEFLAKKTDQDIAPISINVKSSPEEEAYADVLIKFEGARIPENVGDFLVLVGKGIKEQAMSNSLNMVWDYFKERLEKHERI
jgi:hypothetical protein